MARITRHQAAVPKALLIDKARQCSELQADWLAAKTNNDFALFAAGFERLMPLHREIAGLKAEALGLSPYDALIDENDPGAERRRHRPHFLTTSKRPCPLCWPR